MLSAAQRPRVTFRCSYRTVRVCLALALTLTAGISLDVARAAGAQRGSETRGRKVGIDTRFGDLVREASMLAQRKNYARAIGKLNEAMAMRPDRVNAAMLLTRRGGLHMLLRNDAEAVADYEQAKRLRPRDAGVLNNLAWLRATSPAAVVRNGRMAVQDATRACELENWKDPNSVDTLAAAHAEAGNFERAVEFQKQAIPLAPLSDRYQMHKRVALFQQRTPYRRESARP